MSKWKIGVAVIFCLCFLFFALTETAYAVEGNVTPMEAAEVKNESGKICEDLVVQVSPHLLTNLQMEESDNGVKLGDVKGISTSMPSTGNVTTLVISCDFEGNRYEEGKKEEIDQWFNGEENTSARTFPYESLSAYYKRSSFGKLNLNSVIFEFHAPETRDYYENGEGTELIPCIIEAYSSYIMSLCDGTESEKEAYLNQYLEQFDSDEDGFLDGVYIVFAGEAVSDTFWWSNVDYYNGYSMGEYTWGSTCWLADSQMYDWGSGYYDTTTAIHETGHMLGLPDLYAKDSADWDICTFDIMDENLGDHNGLSKLLLGWIDVEDVPIIKQGECDTITLNPYAVTGDIAIAIPEYSEEEGLYTEFYLMEYYHCSGNDTIKDLQNYDGIRIYHVNARLNDSKTGFLCSNNIANNTYANLIYAYDKDSYGEKNAHLTYYSYAQNSGAMKWGNMREGDYDCMYYEGDELTPYTSPSSYKYDSNSLRDSCEYSGFFVNNIKIENEQATFTAGFEQEHTYPEMTYDVYSSNAEKYNGKFDLRIYFNTEIRLKENQKRNYDAYVVDNEGNKILELEMILYPYSYPYNYLTFVSGNSAAMDAVEGEYTVVIPEGTILSTYGTSNGEIRIPYDTTKEYPLERFAEATVTGFSRDVRRTYVTETGDGIYFIGEEESTWNSETNTFDDPYGIRYREPANYKMYVVNDFSCGEEISVNVTAVENEQYMALSCVKVLGNGEYGVAWRSMLEEKELFRVIDTEGNVLSERTIDYTGWKRSLVKSGQKIYVYDDKYVIYDYKDPNQDRVYELPDIEGSFNNFVCAEDICILRYGTSSDRKEYIIKDGEIIYIDEGREGDYGRSRAIGLLKIGDYYYYVTELQTKEGYTSIYEPYVDVFDEEFNKIESFKLGNITNIRALYSVATGFVAYTGYELALYDSNFNFVKKLSVSTSELTTDAGSSNLVYVDALDSTITTKRIKLDDLTQQTNKNEIVMPNDLSVEGNKISISEHVKKEDFGEKFKESGYIVSFSGEMDNLQENETISIGYEDMRHMKYYNVKYAEDFTHAFSAWNYGDQTDMHSKNCYFCEEMVSELHEWDEGEITKEPSCAEGVKTYSCEVCDATKKEVLNAVGKHTGGIATCAEKAVCETCLELYGEIDSTNHVGGTEIINAQEPTCKEEGYTGDTHCKGCGAKFATGKTIPMSSNHTWDEGEITKEPSCIDGQIIYSCNVCYATMSEPLAATSQHAGGVATCTEKAVCETCLEPYGESDSTNHAGRTEVVNAKEPTCKEEGYTGDIYCNGCEIVVATGKTIPMSSSHIWDEGEIVKEPSCVEGEMLYSCEVCDVTKTEVLDAVNQHTGGIATCTKKATCENCLNSYGELDLANHAGNAEVVNAQKPTCLTEGYTGDICCKDCGRKVQMGKVLPKTGDHVWDSGVVTETATAIKNGVITFACGVCGLTKEEEVPALGLPETGVTAVDTKTGTKYKVTKSSAENGTVEVSKPKDKKVSTITIPDTVNIDGVSYKVTSIAKNAFSGCKNLTKITIGKNVNKIGTKAFYNCVKLKNVIIKTTKLTNKNVGKQAFKGTPKKITLKVPKKKMKDYKEILQTKGVSKKAKYKK